MSATTAMLRGRALAESLMLDSCTVVETTAVATDDLTGRVTATGEMVRYSGKCKVQGRGATGGSRTDSGEVSVVVLRPELHLPVAGSDDVRHGHTVTITAVGPSGDPALVGRTFVLRDLEPKSFATARRFGMEEAT